jgi:hypothetical protein
MEYFVKYKLDTPAFLTGLRTAGALMVGNVFVAVAILDNRNWFSLGCLLAGGFTVIICSSLKGN